MSMKIDLNLSIFYTRRIFSLQPYHKKSRKKKEKDEPVVDTPGVVDGESGNGHRWHWGGW